MRWCIDVVVVSMLVLAGAGRARAAEPKVPVTKVQLRENPALAKKGKVAKHVRALMLPWASPALVLAIASGIVVARKPVR